MKPAREHATNNAQTYFVTSATWNHRVLFQSEPWARLFFQTLLSYRPEAYLLHEFVLMPDHFHALLSPQISLERSVQLIKGGFSFKAKRELGSNAEIWQRGFSDHRIRNDADYAKHVQYIHLNPVKRHLCDEPEQYHYSSAFPGWKLDPIPQGLKPRIIREANCGTAKAVPFQSYDTLQGSYAGETVQQFVESEREPRNAPLSGVLKGHDFSRATREHKRHGALAPEGGRR